MTVYVDANHAHNLVTRRSITGTIFILNYMLISWTYKRQNTVETSNYGSEMVASRVVTELILEIRYMLQSLGVALDGTGLMLGENMSIALNATVSSRSLKNNIMQLLITE
jgi:hypothetical protein